MQKQAQRKKLKSRIGIVTSDKMHKTVIVKFESFTKHWLYKKIIRRRTSVKAHDEKNEAKIGDKVRIIPSRPLSKDKRFRVLEVIKGAGE